MHSLIGTGTDEFSIYASPAKGDLYHVVIYPDLPGADQALDVPAAAFKEFCRTCRGKIEATQLSCTTDVFICALEETEVRELTVLNRAKSRFCRAA